MSYFSSKSRTLLVAAFVAMLSAGVLIAQQQRNISGLIGRTDDNLNLYVRGAAAGAAGQSSNIGGLVGRTDANLNLYVTFDGTVPNTMGTGLFADGTSLLPSIAFASEPGLGIYRSSAGRMSVVGVFNVMRAYTITSPGYYTFNPADYGISVVHGNAVTGVSLKFDALPTIASGFGTSPSVTGGSTPFAGSVNVGTGGVATNGTINFNGTAFPSTPFCVVTSSNTPSTMRAAASATQLTIAASAAWSASEVVNWHCISAK